MSNIYQQQSMMKDQLCQQTSKQSHMSNKSSDKNKLLKQVTFLNYQLQMLSPLKFQSQNNLSIRSQNNNKMIFDDQIITNQQPLGSKNTHDNTNLILKQEIHINTQQNINNINEQTQRLSNTHNNRQRVMSFRIGRIIKNNNNNQLQQNNKITRQSQTIQLNKHTNNRRKLLFDENNNKNINKELTNSQVSNCLLNSNVNNNGNVNRLLNDNSKQFFQNRGLKQQINTLIKPVQMICLSNNQYPQSFFNNYNSKIHNNNKLKTKNINYQSNKNFQQFSSKEISTSHSSRKNIRQQLRFRSRLMSQNKKESNQKNMDLFYGKILKNVSKINNQQKSLITIDSHSLIMQNQQILKQQIPNNTFSLSQLPYFIDKPHQKSNKQEIIELTLRIAKKLKINQQLKLENLQFIVIKKYKNCLIFKIPSIKKKIIWYYDGKFYFGQGQKQGDQAYKQGYGIQYLPDKSFYKGQYYKNKKHGQGVIITCEGKIYEGQWFQGQYHGIGKFFNSQSNSIYQGQFKYGKYNGHGILKTSENQIYKGSFIKNIKQGHGIQLFKNGDKYKGQYLNGKFNGYGCYKWSNGSIYEGNFVKGIRTGYGKWFSSLSSDKEIYIGMYLNDKKHGYGRYQWGDGSIYEGQFIQDKKHGDGQIIYCDNKRVIGRWQNNRLVEVYESLLDRNNRYYNIDVEDNDDNNITKVGLYDDDDEITYIQIDK